MREVPKLFITATRRIITGGARDFWNLARQTESRPGLNTSKDSAELS